MDIKIWWVWIAIAAFFVVAEIFHMGFFLLWFGVGAAVAGILSLLGFGMGWQLLSFIVVSAVFFAVSRRFAEKFTKKQPPGVGADRFIDKKGVVIEEINNLKNTGRVRIGKDEWRADSDTGEVISPGQIVEVIKVEGTHLIIKVSKGGG